MTTDSETKVVRDFLLSNPDHLTVARVVYESWPVINDDVCRRFLERLGSRIEQKLKGDEGIRVGGRYVGERAYSNQIWLYRTG